MRARIGKDKNYNIMKTYEINLNTGENARVEHLTRKITGKLKVLIIENIEPINVDIVLDSYNVVIFRTLNTVGQRFIPLKCRQYAENEEVFVNVSDDWFLDDKIKIFVHGRMNTDIKISFRYEEMIPNYDSNLELNNEGVECQTQS